MPLAASQRRRVLSSEPLLRRDLPSGLKATAETTGKVWPSQGAQRLDRWRHPRGAGYCHLPPLSRDLPSGLKATAVTQWVWPSQGAQRLAAGGIPEAQGVVPGAAEQGLAVGAEGHRRNRGRALPGAHGLTRSGLPQAQRLAAWRHPRGAGCCPGSR